MEEKKCEFCELNFKVRQKSQIGKFCSRRCQCRGQKRIRDLKRTEDQSKQSYEQVLEEIRTYYERFVQKNESGCWGWNGCLSSGYGTFTFRRKLMKAHRASWAIHNGEIPKNSWVLHKCDVRICSNPDHLFLGNSLSNVRDMLEKGRHPENKLNVEKVKEIKSMIKFGIPLSKIAIKFGTHRCTIDNIKHLRTWKDIEAQ